MSALATDLRSEARDIMIGAPLPVKEYEPILRRAAEALDRYEAETIVAAAIRVWNTTTTLTPPDYPEFFIVSAPPPARHHSLIHPMSTMIGRWSKGPEDQGFLTSTGRYVGREEGLQIALASGQPMIDHPSRHATLLFSEDLW